MSGPSLIKPIVIGQFAGISDKALGLNSVGRSSYHCQKREKEMRALLAAALAMVTSAAVAAEVEDAHRQAVAGRDTYWNCLAREYGRDGNKTMSGQNFTSLIANVCPSERQNFRVMLVSYLSLQFPDADVGSHMTTANDAIALAQKDIVTAFIRHIAAGR